MNVKNIPSWLIFGLAATVVLKILPLVFPPLADYSPLQFIIRLILMSVYFLIILFAFFFKREGIKLSAPVKYSLKCIIIFSSVLFFIKLPPIQSLFRFQFGSFVSGIFTLLNSLSILFFCLSFAADGVNRSIKLKLSLWGLAFSLFCLIILHFISQTTIINRMRGGGDYEQGGILPVISLALMISAHFSAVIFLYWLGKEKNIGNIAT